MEPVPNVLDVGQRTGVSSTGEVIDGVERTAGAVIGAVVAGQSPSSG